MNLAVQPPDATRSAPQTAVSSGSERAFMTLPEGGRLELDDQLVMGLRLPHIPGLPDRFSAGTSLSKLLAPPAPGSLAQKADMAVVKGAQLLRTKAGDAWAQQLDRDGTVRIWSDFARQHRQHAGVVQGWLGTAILAATMAATGAATAVGKLHYDRPRPFQVDAAIRPPVRLPRGSSYPSGHSSSAFAAARVIATLEPALADAAYNLATQVAVSRVYAGVHYPTDVVAGALLGTAVAEGVLRATHRR